MIGTGSKTSYHYIAEATYGTTPATPTWTPLCLTGFTLNPTKETVEDECLRADRQVEDVRHGNEQVGGDLTTRLSYGDFDDLIEAMAMGTWTADVLKAGVTFRSFTVEQLIDLDTNEYHRYTGTIINTMSLSVQPNAMIDLTFGVIGQQADADTAEIAGSTYSAASGNSAFDSFSGVVQEGGVASGIITQIDLSWENGYEAAFVVGSKYTIQPGDGKSRLTGTLTAYYESKALYEKFLNETDTSLRFTLVSPEGDQIEFYMPNVKYTSATKDVSGEGNITIPLEFSALYDGTELSQVVITRTPV